MAPAVVEASVAAETADDGSALATVSAAVVAGEASGSAPVLAVAVAWAGLVTVSAVLVTDSVVWTEGAAAGALAAVVAACSGADATAVGASIVAAGAATASGGGAVVTGGVVNADSVLAAASDAVFEVVTASAAPDVADAGSGVTLADPTAASVAAVGIVVSSLISSLIECSLRQRARRSAAPPSDTFRLVLSTAAERGAKLRYIPGLCGVNCLRCAARIGGTAVGVGGVAESGANAGAVLIADPDDADRAAIARVFEAAGYAVRQVASGEAALDAARDEAPSAVVLEVALGGDFSGYEVCRALRGSFGPELPIVFLSGVRTESYDRVAGLLVGADDYLVKPYAADELLTRVRRLHPRPASGAAKLTKREEEVLRLLAEGLSQSTIAEQLFISSKTVGTHIEHILRKLGVQSRAQAVAVAYRDELVLLAPHARSGSGSNRTLRRRLEVVAAPGGPSRPAETPASQSQDP